jgi:hypothetical protein
VGCSVCGRLLNCRYNADREDFDFWPQQGTFTCKGCETFNETDAHDMKPGEVVQCSGCGARFEVEERIGLMPIANEADGGD